MFGYGYAACFTRPRVPGQLYLGNPRNSSTHALLVDPGDAKPVLAALARMGLSPAGIFCTHHHHDHVGGIPELLEHFPGLPVYGPMRDQIEGLTHPLCDDDQVQALVLGLNVLDIPGHTRGHIAY